MHMCVTIKPMLMPMPMSMSMPIPMSMSMPMHMPISLPMPMALPMFTSIVNENTPVVFSWLTEATGK